MTAGLFRDRVAAGQALARKLSRWQGADAVVLGVVVCEVGVPGRPELAMGAQDDHGRP